MANHVKILIFARDRHYVVKACERCFEHIHNRIGSNFGLYGCLFNDVVVDDTVRRARKKNNREHADDSERNEARKEHGGGKPKFCFHG